jgi:hypothetical protein
MLESWLHVEAHFLLVQASYTCLSQVCAAQSHCCPCPVCALLFYAAFGFAAGSNDVGNAFATSVGAKTLSMRQAVLVGAVFEFLGALVLGRVTTGIVGNAYI